MMLKPLLICCLLLPQCWAAWTYKQTIACGSATGANQTNFPLLVKISDPVLKSAANGGHIQNSGTQTGGNAVTMPFDLIFTSDSAGTTKIPWEIEFWDATAGTLVAYVQVPTLLSVGSASIYMFYDDAAVNTQQNTTTVAPSQVWSSSYVAVLHFPNGTTLSTSDSTSNGFNATGVNTPTAATGQVDGGVGLASASTQYLTLVSNSSLNPSAITYMAWVNATSLPAAYNAVLSRVNVAPNDFTQIMVKSNGKLYCAVAAAATTVAYDGTGTNTLSTATWYHLALTYDSTTGLHCYVNGAVDGTAGASGALVTSTNAVTSIGTDLNTAGRNWNGVIDEPRIMNVAATANFVSTVYNSQNNPTFNSISGEQPATGGRRRVVLSQ